MLKAHAQSILSQAKAYRTDMVELLSTLVRLESPTEHPAQQDPVFDVVNDVLQGLGFHSRRLRGSRSGGQLLAYPQQRDRSLPCQLLMGHVDTVWPVGTLDTMPLTIGDDVLHGPGAYDMKAGVVILLYALRILVEQGAQMAVSPVVFLNSDEEKGSFDSASRIARLARCCCRALVMEPSLGREGRLKTARKGVGRFTLEVEGRAAHAGLDPESGASAILELSHQVQQLFALNIPARGITVNVGMVEGGMGVNVIAPSSRAEIDVRVPSADDAQHIREAFAALRPVTPNVRVNIRNGSFRNPMERNPRNQQLWQTAAEMAALLDVPIEQGISGGASDGNITSQYTATLDGLGAVGEGAHAHHEQVRIDSLPERAALLALLMQAPPAAVPDRQESQSDERSKSDSPSEGEEDSSCTTPSARP